MTISKFLAYDMWILFALNKMLSPLERQLNEKRAVFAAFLGLRNLLLS